MPTHDNEDGSNRRIMAKQFAPNFRIHLVSDAHTLCMQTNELATETIRGQERKFNSLLFWHISTYRKLSEKEREKEKIKKTNRIFDGHTSSDFPLARRFVKDAVTLYSQSSLSNWKVGHWSSQWFSGLKRWSIISLDLFENLSDCRIPLLSSRKALMKSAFEKAVRWLAVSWWKVFSSQ